MVCTNVRSFTNMERVVICTANAGKLKEFKALLPAGATLLSLSDVGIMDELPETGDTLEANALQKAREAHRRCGEVCVADDTGLEVDVLHGAPGARSARYAGPDRNDAANMRHLLQQLQGHRTRTARFRTVLALVDQQGEHLFEGTVEGRILEHPFGEGGFGYDPVFAPRGSDRSFAEMSSQEKNAVSHRAKAAAQFVNYLNERRSKQGS
jgi:XTP/dITP diphosphohydrolase